MTPLHRRKRQIFTPLLTPFCNGSVDIVTFETAIDRQIAAGVDGVVVGDWVGEGPTLDLAEHELLVARAVERAGSRLGVIAATGTNCTSTTIERCRRAEAMGADALLVTVPYYSKPGLAGVVEHFRQICGSVSIPVLIDDDPGRTAKDYGLGLLSALAHLDIIAGIVHGADRLAHFAGLSGELKDRFLHLSRDDLTLPTFLSLGGHGGLSPLANIIPAPLRSAVSMSPSSIEAGSFTMTIAGAAMALGRDDVAALKEAASFLHAFPAELRLPLVAAEPETVIRVRHAFAAFARSEGQIAA